MFSDVSQVFLGLFVNQSDGLLHQDNIWMKTFSHMDKWHRQFITIQPQKNPFRVCILNTIKSVYNYYFILLTIYVHNQKIPFLYFIKIIKFRFRFKNLVSN